jgi:hypothetical protein
LLKNLASFGIIPKHIKAGTGRRQEHDITGNGGGKGHGYGLSHIRGGLDRGLTRKGGRHNSPGFAQQDHLLDFAAQQGEQRVIISAFVAAAGDQDNGTIKMFQGADDGPDIRGLGVVEEINAAQI